MRVTSMSDAYNMASRPFAAGVTRPTDLVVYIEAAYLYDPKEMNEWPASQGPLLSGITKHVL